jgi:hypothetical protein
MPEKGHVTGFFVYSTEARTAGTLTIEVFKNGVQMTSFQYNSTNPPQAVLNASNTTTAAYVALGFMDLQFAKYDLLDLRVTTDGSWAPTTADIRAGISVELHR